MSEIIKLINGLAVSNEADSAQECTAAELANAVCFLVGEVYLSDDDECDRLSEWEAKVRMLTCEILGGHRFEYDHCGYWGHKYCVNCHAPMYPELNRLRCSEAIEKIGPISEDEYQSSLPKNQTPTQINSTSDL